MPYKPLRGIKPPQNETDSIWRYFDFSKFAFTLLSRSLFFARMDLLGDPYEGSVSLPTVEAREAYYRKLQRDQALPESAYEHLMELSPQFTKDSRAWLFVNCWCMSQYESPALWRLYGKGIRAVAIKSTFARLRDSLSAAPQPIHIGTVNYVDYETEVVPAGNPLHLAFHKRRGFEHERELRAVFMHVPTKEKGIIDTDAMTLTTGHPIPVDIATLIDSVFVAPTAEPWFLELVRSVAANLGFPNLTIMPSRLDIPPRF